MQLTEIIKNPQFEAYVKQIVLETMKHLISETPPKDELAQFFLLHIRDMQTFKLKMEEEFAEVKKELADFKLEVAQEFKEVRQDIADFKLEVAQEFKGVKQDIVEIKQDIVEIKQDIVEIKQDIVEIKDNMVTKQFWEQEKIRLLHGIGEVMRNVIKEEFKRN